MNPVIAVGNKITRPGWEPSEYVTVTAVGREMFLGVGPCGLEDSAIGHRDWVLWSPPARRAIVELRPPNVGESFAHGGAVVWVTSDHPQNLPRWVIVGEPDA